jgi:hypothetical protein
MLDAKKRLQELKDKESKRTTIILDKDERDFINTLIEQDKEAGIKPLFSKMLGIYKDMMICDWHYPGEYYCGISRVALINVEIVNIAIQNIPKEKIRQIGKNIGTALKISLETSLGIDATKQQNWETIFQRLKIQGLGDFSIKDKYLLIKTPFVENAQIWEGLMENLLNAKLETKNSSPPLVFEVKTFDAST